MRRSCKIATFVAFALTLAGEVNQLEAQYSGPVAMAQHSESAASAPPPVKNQTLVSITGGAALNSGNTRAYTVTLGGHLGYIHDRDQLTLDVLGLMNATKAPLGNGKFDDHYEKTAANIIGKARYDRFLSNNDALFAAVVPRRDTFAGLDLRLQMQAGYLRNLYAPSAQHRFWTELGYDLTYDKFTKITTTQDVDIGLPAPVTYTDGSGKMVTLPAGTGVVYKDSVTSTPHHEFVHSARVFLGYSNSLSTLAVINLGAEFLFDVTYAKNVRVNTVADITTSLGSRFKLGFVSRMFFDNVPVSKTYEKADFVSTLQVIYTYDSAANAPKAADNTCDEQVKKATDEAQASCAAKQLPNAELLDGAPLPEPAAGSVPGTPGATEPAPTTSPADAAPVPATTTTPAQTPVAPQEPVAPPAAPQQ